MNHSARARQRRREREGGSPADKRRRIAVISTSRADYGHLYWVLRELDQADDVDLRIIATGSHLAPTFGRTISQFSEHGFTVEAHPECLLDSDSDTGMAKTIGVSILSLADILDRLRPDLLLLIADRYEMLAPAATALALRIPIAHIEGGEISEGAIDDAVRNALTKMSHLHFVSTRQARRRVIAMGEESWRVHHAGAPSLDHLERSGLPGREELEKRLGMSLHCPPTLVAFHPVTLDADPAAESRALFSALDTAPGPIIFSFPNADAGHQTIIEQARAFCRQRTDASIHTNLDLFTFWALLKTAGMMIGNSSSGIMESPSLALPCVNIGIRQQGRERAGNIIDVPARQAAIAEAIGKAGSDAFRQQLEGMTNPYGDGRAATRIAGVLRSTPLGQELLMKKAIRLCDDDPPAFDQNSTTNQ